VELNPRRLSRVHDDLLTTSQSAIYTTVRSTVPLYFRAFVDGHRYCGGPIPSLAGSRRSVSVLSVMIPSPQLVHMALLGWLAFSLRVFLGGWPTGLMILHPLRLQSRTACYRIVSYGRPSPAHAVLIFSFCTLFFYIYLFTGAHQNGLVGWDRWGWVGAVGRGSDLMSSCFCLHKQRFLVGWLVGWRVLYICAVRVTDLEFGGRDGSDAMRAGKWLPD